MFKLNRLIGFGAKRAAAGVGGNDANTKLLLHFDGSNGGTTFTDSSTGAISPTTVGGNINTSTTQTKFGTTAGAFDGTGDYLNYASNAAWNFGTGDFTVDFWYYPTAAASGAGEGCLDISSYSVLSIRTNVDTSTGINVYLGGAVALTVGANLTQNTWQHIALTRASSTARLFVDGVQKSSASNSTSISGALQVGKVLAGGTSADLTGYMDELRISNIARWTAGFTPAVGAYS